LHQIIYLDAGDDITTVRERLKRAQAPRISLVVPAKSRVFQNLVNLKLLERYAGQFGVEITLVTGDGITRSLASGLRLRLRSSLARGEATVTQPDSVVAVIPAAGSAAIPGSQPASASRRRGARPLGVDALRASRPPARHPRRRHGVLSILGRLAGFILLLALLALVGMGVVLALPEATIRLTPATDSLVQTLGVRASTDYRSADLAKSQLPARLIQATVEDAAQADATGKKQEPAQRATGSVRFTNRSGADLSVPMGVVVRTGTGTPVRFVTTVTTTVQAGSFAQAPVMAEQAGSEGNVPAWSINQVDGTLSFQVSVLNDAPMSGGAEKQAQLVTAADRQLLRDSLFARLKAASIDSLRNSVQPGDIFLLDQIVVKVEDESFDREVGQVSKTFSLRMRLTASILTVPVDGLNKLADYAVEAKIPAGAALVPGSTKLGSPSEVSVEGNTITFRAEVRAVTVIGLDVAQLRRDLQGQTLEQANEILSQQYRFASEPTITLKNAWLDRLPVLGSRIRVDVVR
jgi:hypothetical protein